MNGVYSPKDRAKLVSMAERIEAANPGLTGVLATVIADRLREELPDLDDLVIGRVLIAITMQMPMIFLEDIPSYVTWQGLAAAGRSMTEPDWRDPA